MPEPIIYVVSDSVGETAELVTKAALRQFNGSNALIKRFPFIELTSHIDKIIEMVNKDNGMIIYTLVKPEIREYMKQMTKTYSITGIDIMGPLMDTFEQKFERAPLNEPGLVRKLDEDYFKRIEAIEFAVKYDDGRDPRGLLMADIILIGVSRTSKTPLSQHLALKSYKVANVPVIPEVDPPLELFQVDHRRCIGLKISPEKLNHIRRERLISLGLDDNASYANIERIKKELKYFDMISERLGCTVIDVTNKAVEETANFIIRHMNKKD
ncbi:pyruvate, water dikinase regulatory protein [Bacillus niameyensis]|uniref:pyruvate, water dikinase regulatory protein n=1 Tax=Bacillus niameyensis TaxID=1522308 RepID=UPI0007806B99|nr:pyruvate, water dikinase regulatory protein [Bacillus niameyensis]